LADSAAAEILAVVVREAVGNSRGQRERALPLTRGPQAGSPPGVVEDTFALNENANQG